MAKENTGPRSRYGKTLIKALACSWKDLSSDSVSRQLRALHEDIRAGGFDTEKKADTFYLETVEGLLDHLQHMSSAHQITEYRMLAKNFVNPGSAKPEPEESDEDLSWMDDDVSMGGLFDEAPDTLTDLEKELIDYVERVQGVWDYHKPFFFKRSTVNKSTLFVVTSVGVSNKTNIKTNVNAAIGSAKLPHIGSDWLYYEGSQPVKHNLDAPDGRTYWGWVFRIIDGTTVRLWMSRVRGYDPRGDESWEQRAKVLIKLNHSVPRGYNLLSAKHEDRMV